MLTNNGEWRNYRISGMSPEQVAAVIRGIDNPDGALSFHVDDGTAYALINLRNVSIVEVEAVWES